MSRNTGHCPAVFEWKSSTSRHDPVATAHVPLSLRPLPVHTTKPSRNGCTSGGRSGGVAQAIGGSAGLENLVIVVRGHSGGH